MKSIKSKVGEIYYTNRGCEIEIIEWFNNKNCTIIVAKKHVMYNQVYRNIINGSIKNPFLPTIHKIGFLGFGKYKSSINGKQTFLYLAWKRVLDRTYSNNYPSYKDVTICEEWHNFQNFAEWYEKKHIQGFSLDKDILIKGNKVYSPETCCFVPSEVNMLFVKCDKSRGNCYIGVYYSKQIKRYVVKVNQVYIGCYKTNLIAFQAYKVAKEKQIKEIAEKHKEKITKPTYRALINYKVEITD